LIIPAILLAFILLAAILLKKPSSFKRFTVILSILFTSTFYSLEYQEILLPKVVSERWIPGFVCNNCKEGNFVISESFTSSNRICIYCGNQLYDNDKAGLKVRRTHRCNIMLYNSLCDNFQRTHKSQYEVIEIKK
jgi:hypothetical protein